MEEIKIKTIENAVISFDLQASIESRELWLGIGFDYVHLC